MTNRLERIPPRPGRFYVPQPFPGQAGVFLVDGTWGTIQPMQVADGVRTVGEVEVLDHLEKGGVVVDTRMAATYALSTLPGAINLPFEQTSSRMAELDRSSPIVFFCNGPACGQSPRAIRDLLQASYPADKLLYYRGGMHVWMTLGLPVVSSA